MPEYPQRPYVIVSGDLHCDARVEAPSWIDSSVLQSSTGWWTAVVGVPAMTAQGVTSQRRVLCRCLPDSNVRGANMELVWGRQDPGGPHVGPMNFAIWAALLNKTNGAAGVWWFGVEYTVMAGMDLSCWIAHPMSNITWIRWSNLRSCPTSKVMKWHLSRTTLFHNCQGLETL